MARQPDFPPLDLKRIQDISEGDVDFEQEVLMAYLQDCRERIERLQEGVPACDLVTVRRDAHTIKGASANVGTTHLHDLARELEHTNPAEDPARASELLLAIQEEFQQVDAFLTHYLQHGAPP